MANKAGLSSGWTESLDSPERENEFLSAIGFSGPSKDMSNTAKEPQRRPQQAPPMWRFADVVKNGTGKAVGSAAKQPPPNNPRIVPVQEPQNAQGRNQAHISSSQWQRTANKPLPLDPAKKYWEAQRIAKGIVSPSKYPTPRNQEDLGGWSAWREPRDTTFAAKKDLQRGVGNPQPPSQPRGPSPSPSPSPWAKAKGDAPPPNRPAARQLSSPSHPGPETPGGRGGKKGGANRRPPQTPIRIADCDPDLTAYRMPRPNRDYAGSSHSLPTLVSSINVSDTGITGGDGAVMRERDIRNKFCVEDINWGVSWLSPFIKGWVAGIPDCPRTGFDQGVDEHWKRDMDTNTGRFLDMVAYPDSFVNHAEIDLALEWHRQNWSSTLLMSRHNTKPRGNQRPGKNWGGHPRNHRDEVLMLEEGFIVEVHETPIERPEYNRYVPRIPCFLRPAEKFDMETCLKIYNCEVETGLQTLDSEPLAVEDFEKILSTAQMCGMPFIVATRGSARYLGLTKGNLSFSVFRQIPFTEKDKHGEILGFAFLSPWQPGLAASSNSSSRASAKMHVFVHPLYRRKKIGFSLLDMLLTTVSDRFSSQTGYDFIDSDDSNVYKNSAARQRQYYRLYISYMVKHQHRTDDKKLEVEQKAHETDLVWVKKMLEDQLNFTEIARYKAAHRSPKGREGGVHWLDEVVFEHTCRFDPREIKEDY